MQIRDEMLRVGLDSYAKIGNLGGESRVWKGFRRTLKSSHHLTVWTTYEVYLLPMNYPAFLGRLSVPSRAAILTSSCHCATHFMAPKETQHCADGVTRLTSGTARSGAANNGHRARKPWALPAQENGQVAQS